MNKHLLSFYSFLICLLLIPGSIKAQRFQLGIISGLNLSELAGDDISSYLGLNTGLQARIAITPVWNLSTEILYSQAGEYVSPIYYPPVSYGEIRLDYLEVPLSISRLFFPKNNYHQKQFSLGLSFVQLINYKAEDAFGTDVTPQIIWEQKRNLIGHLGVSHFFNKQTVLDFRAALGKNESDWAWTLSLRAIYYLGG